MDKPRLHALTSIRGLAALLIVVFHNSGFRRAVGCDDVTHVFSRGYLAVDFFFVLSGFVLAYVYGARFAELNGRQIRNFIGLRLARIYPLHLFILGLLVLLESGRWLMGSPAAFAEGRSAGALLSNVLLVHSWGIHHELTWNEPAWSISCEWLIYLLCPLVLWTLLHRLRMSWCFVVTASGIVVLGSISHFSYHDTLNITYDLGVLRCLVEFATGVAAFQLYTKIDVLVPKARAVLDPLAVAFLMVVLAVMHFGGPDILVVPFIALFIVAIARAHGFAGRVLQLKPLVYLGEISYAVYLSQALIAPACWNLESRFLGTDPGPLLALLAFSGQLVLIVAASSLLYRHVETPSRLYLRARFIDDHADSSRSRFQFLTHRMRPSGSS